jgi:hypothetical protein
VNNVFWLEHGPQSSDGPQHKQQDSRRRNPPTPDTTALAHRPAAAEFLRHEIVVFVIVGQVYAVQVRLWRPACALV